MFLKQAKSHRCGFSIFTLYKFSIQNSVQAALYATEFMQRKASGAAERQAFGCFALLRLLILFELQVLGTLVIGKMQPVYGLEAMYELEQDKGFVWPLGRMRSFYTLQKMDRSFLYLQVPNLWRTFGPKWSYPITQKKSQRWINPRFESRQSSNMVSFLQEYEESLKK